MAAAASSEYRAGRGHPAGRWLQHFHRAGMDQPGFFPCGFNPYQFARQHERSEHYAAIQPRQSVSAVDQLFHCHIEIAYDKSYSRLLP